jgi:hypothetical protein
MTMHEHDLDLVADYAQGTLPSRADEARRLIAGCETCAAEFRTQREMRSMLDGLPPVTMSDDERIRLREGVLGLIPARPPAPPAAAPPARTGLRRWYAVGSVAAVLLALVGLVGVLSNMGGVDDSADLAGSPTEESVADDGRAAIEALPPADDAGGDAATDLAQDEMAAAMEGGERFIPVIEDLGAISRAELDAAIEQTLAKVESEPLPAPVESVEGGPVATCASEVDRPIARAILAVVDGEPLEVFFLLPDADGTSVAAFAAPGCEPHPLN